MVPILYISLLVKTPFRLFNLPRPSKYQNKLVNVLNYGEKNSTWRAYGLISLSVQFDRSHLGDFLPTEDCRKRSPRRLGHVTRLGAIDLGHFVQVLLSHFQTFHVQPKTIQVRAYITL